MLLPKRSVEKIESEEPNLATFRSDTELPKFE
jgi:hypothetical protein